MRSGGDIRFFGVMGAMILAIVLLCLYMVQRNNEERTACETKGGEWLKPYKSAGICLRPGAVIP